MTFVTVNTNREQLTLLTQFLVAVFPGCTIFQNCDPARAMRYLHSQSVDAVFADADTCVNMMDLLFRQNEKTQICLLREQDTALPDDLSGFDRVLSYPITEQKMRNALQKTP